MDNGITVQQTKLPISSPLIEEPSWIDVIQTHGEKSTKFLSQSLIYPHIVSQFPSIMVNEFLTKKTFGESTRFYMGDVLKKIQETVSGVSCKVIGTEIVPLRIGELHRPCVPACTATYTQSYNTSKDFSLAVKIFGIGGGATYSRQFGYSTSIKTSDSCIALTVPTTIEWSECTTKNGTKYYRSKIIDIGDTIATPALIGQDDNCNTSPADVDRSHWQTKSIPPIPSGVERDEKLSLETDYGAEFSLQSKVFNIEIGPKVDVKYVKKTECSYHLIGPHDYTAFMPFNVLGYCWFKP